jgi:hypothetical protein
MSNETRPIPDLIGVVKVDTLRRDPLRSVLVASNLFLAIVAFLWTIWTSHDWIRLIDAAIAVVAMVELARLLWFWQE